MLRRNRDFALLQGGQLLSAAGSESTAIAYPLLVLALTNSPVRAGLVGFARIVPYALFGLLAGVAADRYDRRRVMIAADGVRALAVGALGVSVAAGAVAFWQIPLVAFVEGAGSAFFAPAAAGALRSVVPVGELAAAAGVQQVRTASVGIAGPPVGGALFGLGAPSRSWLTPAPTRSPSRRCWRCARRSRSGAARSARGCWRGCGSCGRSRSCAPPRCCTRRRTSSGRACCSAS